MSKLSVKIKESLKSALILLLLFGALLLIVLRWFGTSVAYQPEIGFYERVYNVFSGTVIGKIFPEPASEIAAGLHSEPAPYYPEFIAYCKDMNVKVLYNENLTASGVNFLEKISAMAAGLRVEAENLTEEDWIKALSGQGLLVSYYAPIQLELMMYSFSYNGDLNEFGIYRSDGMFFYESTGVLKVLLRTENDNYLLLSSDGLPAGFSELRTAISASRSSQNAVLFMSVAEDYDLASSQIKPETLISDEELQLPIFFAVNPIVSENGIVNLDSANKYMKMIGVNPYNILRYPESNGTIVFVENFSYSRISPSGRLDYVCSDDRYALKLSSLLDIRKSYYTRGDMMDAARSLLSRFENEGGFTSYIKNVYFDNETQAYTFEFGYLYNGIDISSASEHAPFASVTIRNDSVVSLSILIRNFTDTGTIKQLHSVKNILHFFSGPISKDKFLMSVKYDAQTGEPFYALA